MSCKYRAFIFIPALNSNKYLFLAKKFFNLINEDTKLIIYETALYNYRM